MLAHEIGHHLNGHTVSGSGSQPAAELEADEFSGYVLRKMGASLAQAQAAMQTLASARASRTHPARYDRLTAIAQGWNHADGQLDGRQTVQKNPAVTQPRVEPVTTNRDVASNTARPRLDSRNILGDVYFNADPAAKYHVTANYNLVKIDKRSISVLGKLVKLNSTQFPYMIYDEQNTRLLIDRKGNIVTRTGKQVGLLKNHTT